MQSVPFFGERLHEVRELRGFTIQQVADFLGVSKQAVSLYEKAKCKPSHDVFVKLTELLKVPSHFFSRPPLASHSSPIFYRSMASATKQTRDAAEQKLKWLRAIVAYLATFVDIPPIAIPECKFPSDPTKITDEAVEHARY